MSKRRIHLVEGLLEPLSFEVIVKLNQNSKRRSFSWFDYKTARNAEHTVYGAMLFAAQGFCRKAHLYDVEAAEDAVTRTCVEICEINERDGPKATR